MTWRRSAVSRGGASTVAGPGAAAGVAFASPRSAAMASRSLRRCPRAATPSSFKSSAVKFGRTASSISFSRKTFSYCPRPRLRSQTTTSIMTPLRVATGTSLTLASKAHSAKRNHTTTTRALRGNWRGRWLLSSALTTRLGCWSGRYRLAASTAPAHPAASPRWRRCAGPLQLSRCRSCRPLSAAR